MKQAVADLDWDITAQGRGCFLFDSPQKFALRPDIVIATKDDKKIILDTKWKSLEDVPQKNYGISQSDMYQMYAYSKKYETPNIWLLYPVNSEMRNHEDITFQSKDNVTVKLFFVDVANIDASLSDLKTRLIQSHK